MRALGIFLVIVAIIVFIVGTKAGNLASGLAVTSILVGILGILLTLAGKK